MSQIVVENRRADSLTPDPKNARKHSPAQIEEIAASILEFGWTIPILVDDVIRAGNGRHAAAMLIYERKHRIKLPGGDLLPDGEVPVIDCTGWSEAQKAAYALADNKIALNAEWHEDQLRETLANLMKMDFDVKLAGFGDDDLKAIMGKLQARSNPEEVPPVPRVPVTVPGDCWLLGSSRIICGDATDEETVKRLFAHKLPAVMVTDPPYGIGFEYASHDDSSSDANAELVAKVFALARFGKVWTPGLMNAARDIARFGKARMLCWHKGFAAAGNGLGGASTWEPILVIDPPKKGLPNDYLDFKTERVELEGKSLKEHHPCPKPVALFVHLIESLTKRTNAIYEPFSGSGTTLLAGETVGRAVMAMEIDPAYVDVAVIRWQGFTGQAAIRESDGKRFDELQRALEPAA